MASAGARAAHSDANSDDEFNIDLEGSKHVLTSDGADQTYIFLGSLTTFNGPLDPSLNKFIPEQMYDLRPKSEIKKEAKQTSQEYSELDEIFDEQVTEWRAILKKRKQHALQRADQGNRHGLKGERDLHINNILGKIIRALEDRFIFVLSRKTQLDQVVLCRHPLCPLNGNSTSAERPRTHYLSLEYYGGWESIESARTIRIAHDEIIIFRRCQPRSGMTGGPHDTYSTSSSASCSAKKLAFCVRCLKNLHTSSFPLARSRTPSPSAQSSHTIEHISPQPGHIAPTSHLTDVEKLDPANTSLKHQSGTPSNERHTTTAVASSADKKMPTRKRKDSEADLDKPGACRVRKDDRRVARSSSEVARSSSMSLKQSDVVREANSRGGREESFTHKSGWTVINPPTQERTQTHDTDNASKTPSDPQLDGSANEFPATFSHTLTLNPHPRHVSSELIRAKATVAGALLSKAEEALVLPKTYRRGQLVKIHQDASETTRDKKSKARKTKQTLPTSTNEATNTAPDNSLHSRLIRSHEVSSIVRELDEDAARQHRKAARDAKRAMKEAGTTTASAAAETAGPPSSSSTSALAISKPPSLRKRDVAHYAMQPSTEPSAAPATPAAQHVPPLDGPRARLFTAPLLLPKPKPTPRSKTKAQRLALRALDLATSPHYCTCYMPAARSRARLVACSNKRCPVGLFHAKCVGGGGAGGGREKGELGEGWVCPVCAPAPKMKMGVEGEEGKGEMEMEMEWVEELPEELRDGYGLGVGGVV